MIVNRRTFIAKRGRTRDLVALMLAEQAHLNLPITFRVYSSNIAPFDQVVGEWEFENLVEYDKFWNDWFAMPGNADFMEKWYALTENGGSSQIWNLEE